MKLGILSCSPRCYSTRRLREAAETRGHKVKVLNTIKFAIDLEQGEPDLLLSSKAAVAAMTPSCLASAPRSRTSVRPSCGSSNRWMSFARIRRRGIANSRDKLRSLQILSRHHIGIPQSAFVRDKKDVLAGDRTRVGGAPVIIKLLEGTQGIGVLLAETSRTRRKRSSSCCRARSRTC